MKIFDLQDSDGRAYAFEVSNAFLGRRGASRVASRVAGARILRSPRRWSWGGEESFCEFEVAGVRFEIAEPFGDNSRYWVGPVPTRPVPELALVRDAFARAGVFANFFAPAG